MYAQCPVLVACDCNTLKCACVPQSASSPSLPPLSPPQSPIPPHQWYSQQRQQQMAESLQRLEDTPVRNVVFAGKSLSSIQIAHRCRLDNALHCLQLLVDRVATSPCLRLCLCAMP